MAGIFTSLMAFIQKISRTPANYWGEFIIDIPLGIFLFYEGLHLGNITLAAVLLTTLAGLLFFSLLEYIVHRRVFHGSIMFIVKSHQLHHEVPWAMMEFRFSSGLASDYIDRFFFFIPAPELRIDPGRGHRLRLCLLWPGTLSHSSPPFSQSSGSTLGIPSSNPSFPSGYQLRSHNSAVG